MEEEKEEDKPLPTPQTLAKYAVISNVVVGVPEIAQRTNVSEEDVRAIFDVIVGFLGDGTNVNIPKFGKFTSVYMPPMAYKSNLVTGISKPKILVKFRLSNTVRDMWMERLRKIKGVEGGVTSHYALTESGREGLSKGRKAWKEFHQARRKNVPEMVKEQEEAGGETPLVVDPSAIIKEGVIRRRKLEAGKRDE